MLPSASNLVMYNADAITSYAKIGFVNNPVGSLDAYVNGKQDRNSNDFKVQINWGDNTGWQPGKIGMDNTPGGRIPFVLKGSHIYSHIGNYKIQVQVTGDGMNVTQINCSASVLSLPAPASLPGTPPADLGGPKPLGKVGLVLYERDVITTVAGKTFQAIVASADGYYNGPQDPSTGDYKVQINWGDSPSWDIGQVVVNTTPGTRIPFYLQGSHAYANPGTYPIVVMFTGPDGQTLSKQTDAVQVKADPGTPDGQEVGKVLQGFVQGFGDGIWQRTVGAVMDVVNAITHPVETVNNVANGIGSLANGIAAVVSDPAGGQKVLQGLTGAGKALLDQFTANPVKNSGRLLAEFIPGPDKLLKFAKWLGGFEKFAAAAQKVEAAAQKLQDATTKLKGLAEADKLLGDLKLPRAAALNQQILQGYILRTRALLGAINPAWGDANCGRCAIAGVYLLKDGSLFQASLKGPVSTAALERYFGKEFSKVAGGSDFIKQIQAGTKPGSVGVVRIRYGWDTDNGHVFNYVNLNGQIHFVDFQTGEVFQDLQAYAREGFFNHLKELNPGASDQVINKLINQSSYWSDNTRFGFLEASH